jgi:predicted RNA binding protein YcfA (HicA-like mRNA interferase family)
MASPKRTLTAVEEGHTVPFRDLARLLEKLGFRLVRMSGSHHIYVHPKANRPINIQPDGKDAKPYQVRQLRGMIAEFGLALED